jgi:hypothetical protein
MPTRPGGHIPEAVWARICPRVLAVAAEVWLGWTLWPAGVSDCPGRNLINYDH